VGRSEGRACGMAHLMAHGFVLRVQCARSGVISELDVAPSDSVSTLKQSLLRQGTAPQSALRLHVAHHGRLLADDELLEVVRAAPIVILAAVLPAAAVQPAPSPSQPTHAVPPAAAASAITRARPPPTAAAAHLRVPSREDIAAAWARAFPSDDDGGAHANNERQPHERPQPQPQQEQEQELEERLCRVCFCGEEVGALIQPCRCRGSVRLVHARCLNEWRAQSANPRSFARCDTCGYAYRTERLPMAAWLQDERTVLGATSVAFLLLILIGALLPCRPHRLLYFLLELHPSLSHPWWGGRCDRLVVGLSLPAVLGFCHSLYSAYRHHRGLPLEDQRWAIALLLSIAADGSRLLRPLLALGLLHFARQLAREMRLVCRQLLTRFGERVLDLQMVAVQN